MAEGQLCFLNAWYLFPIVRDSSIQLLLLDNNPSLCVTFEGHSVIESCLPSCAARLQQASLNLTPGSLKLWPSKPAAYRWHNLEGMKGKASLRLPFLRMRTARGEWWRGKPACSAMLKSLLLCVTRPASSVHSLCFPYSVFHASLCLAEVQFSLLKNKGMVI